MGIKTVILTGSDGADLAKMADLSLLVPSKVTARIQEAHIAVGHIICEMAEQQLC
jgi:D-sedoheptulose 7-phosphate isomerase